METKNTIKILLVDDEVKFLDAISSRLLMKGFDVTTATNGDDAIEAANKGGFDVAMLDLQMPGTDGSEVLRILKQTHKFIEIIMLTGHATLESAVECTRLGAFNYLGKPYDFDKLVEALKEKDWRIRSAALAVADLIRDFRVLRRLLLAALTDEHWRVRSRAARATAVLGALNDPDAFDVMTAALEDKHPNVRARATEALAERKDARAVVPLIAVLREDPNSYVRRHAAIALGELKDPRAVRPLTAALNDESEVVKTSAKWALEKIRKAAQLHRI